MLYGTRKCIGPILTEIKFPFEPPVKYELCSTDINYKLNLNWSFIKSMGFIGQVLTKIKV
jgi:hypothetical protein